MFPDLENAAEFVKRHTGDSPFEQAVVLGSGLGDVTQVAELEGELEYLQLPGFSHGAVPGHAGRLQWGKVNGRRVLFFQGRFHLYQGLQASQVVAPVVLAGQLGCRKILLTNASGAINPNFLPGDPVFITDHINFSGENPLRGISPPPFLDLTNLYHRERYEPMRSFLKRSGVTLHAGVLAALCGPTYETPAEIRMLRTLGADLVSMSTVHEAIAAHYLGLSVTALSVVANPAAGLADGVLAHEDVLIASQRGSGAIQKVLAYLLEQSHATPNML